MVIIGAPVSDDQVLDVTLQQGILEVGVFQEACGPKPGVKPVWSFWVALTRAPEKPCLEVASLEDNLPEVLERNLLPQTVSLLTSRWFLLSSCRPLLGGSPWQGNESSE